MQCLCSVCSWTKEFLPFSCISLCLSTAIQSVMFCRTPSTLKGSLCLMVFAKEPSVLRYFSESTLMVLSLYLESLVLAVRLTIYWLIQEAKMGVPPNFCCCFNTFLKSIFEKSNTLLPLLDTRFWAFGNLIYYAVGPYDPHPIHILGSDECTL